MDDLNKQFDNMLNDIHNKYETFKEDIIKEKLNNVHCNLHSKPYQLIKTSTGVQVKPCCENTAKIISEVLK